MGRKKGKDMAFVALISTLSTAGAMWLMFLYPERRDLSNSLFLLMFWATAVCSNALSYREWLSDKRAKLENERFQMFASMTKGIPGAQYFSQSLSASKEAAEKFKAEMEKLKKLVEDGDAEIKKTK
jgi:hypothetical protein